MNGNKECFCLYRLETHLLLFISKKYSVHIKKKIVYPPHPPPPTCDLNIFTAPSPPPPYIPPKIFRGLLNIFIPSPSILSVVFSWLRHKTSGKRFSRTVGAWVLVCEGYKVTLLSAKFRLFFAIRHCLTCPFTHP